MMNEQKLFISLQFTEQGHISLKTMAFPEAPCLFLSIILYIFFLHKRFSE